jgi:CPA1 family monovalent cation:H+ antiporter
LTPTGKVAIRSFWEVAAFGVNSVVFLLIGLQVELPALLRAAPAVAIGVLAITIGRIAAVYPLLLVLRVAGRRLPASWQHLLVWGNLKGGLSMALALSLPAALPQRDLLTTVVFGAALVTLTVQGLSLVPFIRALGLGEAGEAEQRVEREQARLISARAAQVELDRLQHLGVLPMGVFQRLRASYQGVIARSERQLRDLITFTADEEPAHVQSVRRRLLTVEKSALRDAVNAGILHDEVAGELSAELDRSLAALDERRERG